MKRLFLILVVMAFAVSSAVAKGKDTPQKTLTLYNLADEMRPTNMKGLKCTLTLADGKTVSGYMVDYKDASRVDVVTMIRTMSRIEIADTPDAKKGTEYNANDAKEVVFEKGKKEYQFLSMYVMTPNTRPKNLRHNKQKCFLPLVYENNGIYGFLSYGDYKEKTKIEGKEMDLVIIDKVLTYVCSYCVEGDEVVVPYWQPDYKFGIGVKTGLRYCFERFPKVMEYIKDKNFKMKEIADDPLGFLDKVAELK